MTLEQLKSCIVNKKILISTDLLEFKIVVRDGTPFNELVDIYDDEVGIIIPNNSIVGLHVNKDGSDYYHVLNEQGGELFNIYVIT